MEYIDIRRIIRESNSRVLKRLPGFIISILKRIIREKEINQLLSKSEGLEGYPFLEKMIGEFELTVDINGKENLPESSRCIVAANHPFGVIDGLILAHTISEKYGNIKAIGNDAFMFLKPLRPFIFSVNVFGINTKERIAALDELYASNIAVTHFPAGEVSRKYGDRIQDCSWQKSFITKAILHKRDIVPMHFEGENSRLFHFIHQTRKKLGIKMTLELVLLPHELFNKKGKTIRVSIGKPIPYELLDKRRTHQQWADTIRAYTYTLGTPGEKDFKSFSESFDPGKPDGQAS